MVSNLLVLSILDIMHKKCVFNIRFLLHAVLSRKLIDKCKKRVKSEGFHLPQKGTPYLSNRNKIVYGMWSVRYNLTQSKTRYSNYCTKIREAVILTPFDKMS